MSEIAKGLLIAAVGMGLVFVVIIMLWGVMALLVALTSGKRVKVDMVDEPDKVIIPAAVDDQPSGSERKRKAAVVAVAYLLAKETMHQVVSAPVSQETSNWLALGRARQLNQSGLRGQKR